MTVTNVYATLGEFKNWASARGEGASTDTTDDTVIENILEAASRYIDDQTGRTFYPRIETRYYSVPDDDCLALDDDLLEIITVQDGGGNSLSSSDYNLKPRNTEPRWAIEIKEVSNQFWQSDSDNSEEYNIPVNAWWGYHNRYTQRGWASGGTLSANISATSDTFVMNDGHTLAAGNIVKIGSELMIVASISSSDTITPIKRGDNGSTAAAHVATDVVYVWQPMEDIKAACLMIAHTVYQARKGQVTAGRVTVTASGVVVHPEEVPSMARKIIGAYARWS